MQDALSVYFGYIEQQCTPINIINSFYLIATGMTQTFHYLVIETNI